MISIYYKLIVIIIVRHFSPKVRCFIDFLVKAIPVWSLHYNVVMHVDIALKVDESRLILYPCWFLVDKGDIPMRSVDFYNDVNFF